jgi:hypothetical protein
MVDPTRPDHPAPEPVPDAAVSRLIDALTAPGTPDELSAEQAHVAAFLAARDGRRGDLTRRSRRRLRMVLAGGVAALAVTGTAAALTGSLPVPASPQPVRSSRPTAAAPAPTAPIAPQSPTAPGPGSPGALTSTPSVSAGATPSVSASSTGSTSPPTPTASPEGPRTGPGTALRQHVPHPAPAALRHLGRDSARGTLHVGSGGYSALVGAAGRPAAIPAYCASILPPPDPKQ